MSVFLVHDYTSRATYLHMHLTKHANTYSCNTCSTYTYSICTCNERTHTHVRIHGDAVDIYEQTAQIHEHKETYPQTHTNPNPHTRTNKNTNSHSQTNAKALLQTQTLAHRHTQTNTRLHQQQHLFLSLLPFHSVNHFVLLSYRSFDICPVHGRSRS